MSDQQQQIQAQGIHLYTTLYHAQGGAVILDGSKPFEKGAGNINGNLGSELFQYDAMLVENYGAIVTVVGPAVDQIANNPFSELSAADLEKAIYSEGTLAWKVGNTTIVEGVLGEVRLPGYGPAENQLISRSVAEAARIPLRRGSNMSLSINLPTLLKAAVDSYNGLVRIRFRLVGTPGTVVAG